MEVFQKLGAEVEKQWRDKNYSEEFFPAIAAQILGGFNLPEKVSAWDTIAWALGENYLPQQRDLPGRFGDPPITLYNSPRFHIDIYFWLNGTTSIHQHGFCGAFQVLMGSSIHSDYNFELQEIVNRFTEIGDLNLEHCELLKVGDVRKILAGRDFIHGLFHLDQPSATVVIRTHLSPMNLPQFDYRKPFLAIDPFFEEPTVTKKLQALSMMLRAKHPDADKMVAELLQKADFQTTFVILSNIRHLLQNDHIGHFFQVANQEDRYGKIFDIVRRRHGSLAETLPKIFDKQQKINELINRRNYVTSPELRFFLALLLNVDGKDRILSLVKERFPDSEPLDKVLDWVSELGQTKVLGLNVPNALGIENFDDYDLLVLEDLMRGNTVEEIQANLQSETQNQNSEEFLNNLNQRIEKLRQSVILEQLLTD